MQYPCNWSAWKALQQECQEWEDVIHLTLPQTFTHAVRPRYVGSLPCCHVHRRAVVQRGSLANGQAFGGPGSYPARSLCPVRPEQAGRGTGTVMPHLCRFFGLSCHISSNRAYFRRCSCNMASFVPAAGKSTQRLLCVLVERWNTLARSCIVLR